MANNNMTRNLQVQQKWRYPMWKQLINYAVFITKYDNSCCFNPSRPT